MQPKQKQAAADALGRSWEGEVVNKPDAFAVEAVDEHIPAEVEEVYGGRRHRHLRIRTFPGPPASTRAPAGDDPGSALISSQENFSPTPEGDTAPREREHGLRNLEFRESSELVDARWPLNPTAEMEGFWRSNAEIASLSPSSSCIFPFVLVLVFFFFFSVDLYPLEQHVRSRV